MRMWMVKVFGWGNDGHEARYEALVNADTALEATEKAGKEVDKLYWRDTAHKIQVQEH